MKRLVWLSAALGLSLLLLVAGLLNPFQPEPSGGLPSLPPDPVPATTTSDLTGPATSSRGLDDTIAALQQRLESSPDDWASYTALGLAYLRKGRLTAVPTYYPKAEESLARSLALEDTENFQAMLGMGILAAARHDFEDSLRWAKRARAVAPHNADIRAVMGDAYVELGRYDDAAKALQEMIDLRPDLSAYARVSYFRELHGDVPGATTAMMLAVDAAGGSPEDGAWAGYQLGELYYGTGDIDRARREYARAAYLSPSYALPKVGLAKVAAAKGDLGNATRMLERVVTRYPAPEFVILLGDMYGALGRRGKAERQYEVVRAIQKLYEANGVNTDVETALFDADHRHDLRRALRRARTEYEGRKSVQVADALAWTLYANGRFGPARAAARQAARLGTKNALFMFHRGMIEARLHHLKTARRLLQRALRINPNFSFFYADDARRAVKELGKDLRGGRSAPSRTRG